MNWSFNKKLKNKLLMKETGAKQPDPSQSQYELIAKSEFFDADFYLEHNPDVKAAGVDPVYHYLHHGYKEVRRCSPNFDVAAYTLSCPEIKTIDVPPILHYEQSRRQLLSKLHAPQKSDFMLLAEEQVLQRAVQIYQEQRAEYALDRDFKEPFALKLRPQFAVLLQAFSTELSELKATLSSLSSQLYREFTLYVVFPECVEVPADLETKIAELVNKAEVKLFPHPKNISLAGILNQALKQCSEEYVLLLDQSCVLEPDALGCFATTLNQHPEAEVLYADEARVNAQGEFSEILFKPRLTAELLLNQPAFMQQGVMLKKATIQQAGLFKWQYVKGCLYELMIRLMDCGAEFTHLKRVLLRLRSCSVPSELQKQRLRAYRLVLEDYYAKKHTQAAVYAGGYQALYAKLTFSVCPKVTLLLWAETYETARICIAKIISNTSFPDYELRVLVSPKVIGKLRQDFYAFPSLCFISQVSESCRIKELYEAAASATSEYLVYLDARFYPLNLDWLHRLLDFSCAKRVGMVLPCMLTPLHKIRYAGAYLTQTGGYAVSFAGLSFDMADYSAFNHALVRQTSLPGPDCFLIKKDLLLKQAASSQVFSDDYLAAVIKLGFMLQSQQLSLIVSPYAVFCSTIELEPLQLGDSARQELREYFAEYCGLDEFYTSTHQKLYRLEL